MATDPKGEITIENLSDDEWDIKQEWFQITDFLEFEFELETELHFDLEVEARGEEQTFDLDEIEIFLSFGASEGSLTRLSRFFTLLATLRTGLGEFELDLHLDFAFVFVFVFDCCSDCFDCSERF